MKQYMPCMLVFMICSGLLDAKYHSQSGQDQYIDKQIFKGKRGGVFVDIGAHDGVTYSNTYFFEQDLGWTGICVEPMPNIFKKLEQNRNCICVQGCVADNNGKEKFLCVTSYTPTEYTEMLSGLVSTYDPRHLDRIDKELARFGGKKEIIEVQCYRLDALLTYHNIDHVDYLSIDVEGSEMKVLQSIDFSKVDIDVISVENNYNTTQMRDFLKSKGYKYITKLEGDEIYRKITSSKK